VPAMFIANTTGDPISAMRLSPPAPGTPGAHGTQRETLLD